jgi:cell wall-associated NlpC family hydrolase
MKVKYWIVFLVGMMSANLFAQKNTTPTDSIQADSLVKFAKVFLGTKYCYSNCTPNKGFDCSGFVYFVFNNFNQKVPRSSIEYKGIKPAIPLDSAKAGDIIVFTGTNSRNRNPGHVGIVISNDYGVPTFIHSSSGKKRGVIISDFNESPYYKKRFIKVVRLVKVYK